MAILAELDKLGNEIRRAEKELSSTEGKLEMLIEGLKKDFGVSTEEELKTKLEQITKSAERLQNKIESDFKTLKEEYNW